MTPQYGFASISAAVRSRDDLLQRNWSARGIADAVADGTLERLAAGRYLDGGMWRELWPDQKLLARVLAVSGNPDLAGCFWRESAAVLHGLRLYRPPYDRAQLLLPGASSARRSTFIARSTDRIRDGEVGLLHGVPVTSLSRTVMDLARLAPLELALGALDHALQLQFGKHRGVPNSPGVVEWLERLRRDLLSGPSRRGVRRALRIVELADAGSESVLETLGRLRFVQAGYRVSTQVPVVHPDGSVSYFDLGLDDFDILCEIDGRSKYLDEGLRGGKTAAEVVLAEKRREDKARGSTPKRVIRLMHEDLRTLDSFYTAARAYRLPPPPAAHRSSSRPLRIDPVWNSREI